MRKVLIALSLILAQILAFIIAINLFYNDFLMIIIIMGSNGYICEYCLVIGQKLIFYRKVSKSNKNKIIWSVIMKEGIKFVMELLRNKLF